jgi:FMNH2-dependent dimethyl sulfone monooxygenase
MTTAKATDALRRETSPLFNDRKIKLGTFGSNLGGGCAATTIDGVLHATWPETLAIARLADEMEFEAMVPVGRWRGFGGVTNFNGPGFECFTWAAGVGASTKYPGVFATSHVPTIHPVMAAKQSAAIDHITGGRFALNVVTGWHRPEIEMFGAPLIEHDARYEMAAEWLTIIKRMWTEDDEFDFEGHYYKVNRAFLEPKPIRRPHPVIMNAGGSEKGRHFAAQHCDIAFVVFNPADLDSAKANIAAYRKLAREEYGRELKIWCASYVVQRETEKEARDFLHYYVHEKGDWVAGTNIIETLGLNTQTLPTEVRKAMTEHFIAGWGGYPLVGTNEQVVEGLARLSDIGLDGTVLSWPRYEEGMRQFQRNTIPALQQAGLR